MDDKIWTWGFRIAAGLVLVWLGWAGNELLDLASRMPALEQRVGTYREGQLKIIDELLGHKDLTAHKGQEISNRSIHERMDRIQQRLERRK